ncbi:MAG: DUF3021 domain-containing protein [Ruminococcaceae bacterium]|nr:DUF3021 domain-containing protein [Oscillospiraceae bacterium]
MNKYVKEFLHRGLMFGGFGPIVAAIIYLAVSYTDAEFFLTAKDYFTATVSVYILAFVHAGASVFNQVEHWSLPKSMLCHFSMLYVAYSICYIINSWIPFEPKVLLIFTAVFVGIYFAVWGIVYVAVRGTSKKLNEKLR